MGPVRPGKSSQARPSDGTGPGVGLDPTVSLPAAQVELPGCGWVADRALICRDLHDDGVASVEGLKGGHEKKYASYCQLRPLSTTLGPSKVVLRRG